MCLESMETGKLPKLQWMATHPCKPLTRLSRLSKEGMEGHVLEGTGKVDGEIKGCVYSTVSMYEILKFLKI